MSNIPKLKPVSLIGSKLPTPGSGNFTSISSDTARKRKLNETDEAPVAKRVASIRIKAARRSVSNALRITSQTSKAHLTTTAEIGLGKRAPLKTLPNARIPPSKQTAKSTKTAAVINITKPTGARSRIDTGLTKSKTVAPRSLSTSTSRTSVTNTNLKNKAKNASSLKVGSISANSSISSNRSSGGAPKKGKRPAWDIQGQVNDLKEQLAAAQQKEATIDDILKRLDTLEKEKNCETQKVEVKEKRVYELESERESIMAQLQISRENCQKLHYDLEKSREEYRMLSDKSREEYRMLSEKHQRTMEDLEKKQLLLQNEKQVTIQQNKTITDQAKLLEKQQQQLVEQESDRRKLLNVVQELKGNIRVFCRVRPMLRKELEEFGEMKHIEFVGNDDKSLIITNDSNKPTTYGFDRVFGPETSQLQVFSQVSQLIESALDGYNVCIFAYGQTGAGKTFTMEGGSELNTEADGVIPRALKLVFEKTGEKERFGWKFEISVQHVEIYLDKLRDLLSKNEDAKLEIKTTSSNNKQKVWVKNLSSHKVENFGKVASLLNFSKKKRSTASTAANDRSSRSHAVFIVSISAHNTDTEEKFTSSLNLIDLAGSERVAETGAVGVRLAEAQRINSSLNELSMVISALANKDKHVPYRNSKLTFLLMDSLGGNSKTLMVVNVNPTRRATSETINTLRFATTVNKCCIGTAQRMIKF